MVAITPPPAPSRLRYFTPVQREQVKAIFEAIWPGGPNNPGATDAQAADYLDFLLGGSEATYYEIPAWRALYTAGLAMLSGAVASATSPAVKMEMLAVPEMTLLLSDLSAGKLLGFPDAAWQTRFFAVLRAHCLEGCFADVRWGGNQDNIIWNWMGYPNGAPQDFNAVSDRK